MATSKETLKEKQQRKMALQKKYGKRITIARQGREAFAKKDYVKAQKRYNEYLAILAELKEIDDIFKLSPSMFDQQKEVTEMLLVSHIYWDIARIHEMTPKLQANFYKSLAQFVRFTANQPYQILNAEMLRKYMKKNKRVTPQYPVLNDAYQQIYIQSSKCYIATFCFGSNSAETTKLRAFKNRLLGYPWGLCFVKYYYKISPLAVKRLSEHRWLEKTLTPPIKKLLKGFLWLLELRRPKL